MKIRLFPNIRFAVTDLFPAGFILLFAVGIGIANLVGALEPRGASQTAMAWACTFGVPFVLVGLARAARPTVVDDTGVRWRTLDQRSGFWDKADLTSLTVTESNRITLLVLDSRHGREEIPIQCSGSSENLQTDLRELLAL